MFPEDALFEYVLTDLAEMLAAHRPPAMQPLPCDRYIARSCLQKAVRRAETEIAWRALANLFAYDPRAMWRALIVIALEDVGVPGMDIVARVIAAARNKAWRVAHGGNWTVATALVQQMCESPHCQAACDLLLQALNNPALADERTTALERDQAALASILSDAAQPIEHRAISILALGGGLADGQQYRDPCAVFDLLADAGYASHVVATCRAGWKASRNEMAMLLPLIWREWMIDDRHEVVDDDMPPVRMIGDVPGYAIDQFTRAGNDVARALLSREAGISALLVRAGIPATRAPRAVGDLLFVLEGGLLRRRCKWEIGDQFRLPHRMLPSVSFLGEAVDIVLGDVAAAAPTIANLRSGRSHFRPVTES